jgi:hypothetical protein
LYALTQKFPQQIETLIPACKEHQARPSSFWLKKC